MDINAKIKLIAETMTGYSVVVDTSNGANVELSKITMPCILVFIQETESLPPITHITEIRLISASLF